MMTNLTEKLQIRGKLCYNTIHNFHAYADFERIVK